MNVPLLTSLERIGCGGIILATDGSVVAVNATAHAILQTIFGRAKIAEADLLASGRELIKRLLTRGKTRIKLDSEDWVLIERPDCRPLVMHAIPTVVQNLDGPHTILILIDLDDTPQVSPATLERIFGLTRTEAKLAVLLASGASTSEAAGLQGVSVATARSQLAAIFVKTRTTRQAELVRLLVRLAILP
ncbi:helix-turn-helix transcriptional regulator [Methylobacterium cerastii]|uniref:helix-turn-helix transcriptional regulator n=1 Tax=Methylobacterium cerastii TaxID=932741 RepID=UPI001EE21912|nr:LuxR family transcriptional regulator [Methylobacterium cerastii]